MKSGRKPNIKINEEYILSEKSSFVTKEDYKMLRSNIDFLFPDTTSKIIAVTSSSRNEGKSTNAVNLSLSYAELEKKVMLIDCDLRLPTVAAKLRIRSTEKKGLSNILAENIQWRDAMQTIEPNGLDVITAGTIPPDPTRLMQSDRMRALLSELREHYDYIILDCPPITAVVDAMLLVSIVDGYMLVIRHEATDHKSLSSTLTKLRQAKANILGVVYTDVPVEESKRNRGSYYR